MTAALGSAASTARLRPLQVFLPRRKNYEESMMVRLSVPKRAGKRGAMAMSKQLGAITHFGDITALTGGEVSRRGRRHTPARVGPEGGAVSFGFFFSSQAGISGPQKKKKVMKKSSRRKGGSGRRRLLGDVRAREHRLLRSPFPLRSFQEAPLEPRGPRRLTFDLEGEQTGPGRLLLTQRLYFFFFPYSQIHGLKIKIKKETHFQTPPPLQKRLL